jgi:hypothetical protein
MNTPDFGVGQLERRVGRETMPGTFMGLALFVPSAQYTASGKLVLGLRMGGNIGDHFRPRPNFGQCCCQNISGVFGIIARLAA